MGRATTAGKGFFRSQKFWGVVVALLMLMLLLEIAWFLTIGGTLRDQSIEASQRITYTVQDGSIEGNPAVMLNYTPPAKTSQHNDATSPHAAARTEDASAPENPAHTTDEKPHHTANSKTEEPIHVPTAPVATETKHNEKTIATKPGAAPEIVSQTAEDVPPPKATGPIYRWQHHAREFDTRYQHRPKIAIIITGLGLSRSSTEQALELPKDVGLSFSPYAHNVRQWMESAREKGYELYLDLPLEPEDYPLTDPGPYALLTNHAEDHIHSRLDWILERSPLYVGLVTPIREKFTDYLDTLVTTLHYLKTKQILMVRGKPKASAVFDKALQVSGISGKNATTVIDSIITADAIDAELAKLEKTAREQGIAIAIARPYPVTLRQIKKWQGRLHSKDIILVPPSAVLFEE